MSLETLIADYGLVAVFLGAGIEGETAAVIGGVIAQEGLVSLPLAMAAAVLGSFVADQLFFAFGRHFRDHPRVRRIAARPAFVRALATFERYPVGFIFAFRFLYGLRTASPIAIGTTQVATRRFLMINFAAATLWGALFVMIGYVFGEGFERLIGRLKPGWPTLAV
ncbi:MAG TPA: DedA family protein, partial [Sphingomonas sp.]|nr:DedA family protein [Sphingomonas sp.]